MQFLASQTGLLPTAIFAFVYGMIGLVILTGVYHLLVRLLVGAKNAGLEGTFRVVSYAYVVQVLAWVPLVNVLAGLYGLYLCAFGFQEIHSTTYQRAATIAALPLLLLIIGGVLFGILLEYLLSAG